MFKVEDNGIYRVYPKLHEDGYNIEKLIIPKDIFIEAFNKYIKSNTFKDWERKLP